MESDDIIKYIQDIHHRPLKCLLLSSVLLAGMSVISFYYTSNLHIASAKTTAYDISQYQGYLTNHQTKHLKHEVSFMILRAQGTGADSTIHHNINMMNKYHIPYGVYSYSYYTGDASARREAINLHHIAPHALFYINDIEENDAGSSLNSATRAWSHTMHHLTKRPVVLYSYLYFLGKFDHHTIKTYDTTWIADYGSQPQTNIHYDLWQFSSNYYSRALRQHLDADTIPDGKDVRPLSFWIGNHPSRTHNHNSTVKTVRPVKSKVLIHKIATAKHHAKIKRIKHIKRIHHIHHMHTLKDYYHSGHYFIARHHIHASLKPHHPVIIPKGAKLYISYFNKQYGNSYIGFTKFHHHIIHFASRRNLLQPYKHHSIVHTHYVKRHKVVHITRYQHSQHNHVRVLSPSSEHLDFGYYQDN